MQLTSLTRLSMPVRQYVGTRPEWALSRAAEEFDVRWLCSCLRTKSSLAGAAPRQLGAWRLCRAHLPRLERLSLKYNSNLPDCLSLLVTLSELKLNRASIGMPAPAANAAVNAALQQLTQVLKVGSARALLVDKDGNSAG